MDPPVQGNGGARLEPGPIPLYYQLEQELRGRIEADEFPPGAAFLTEDQICEQYGVSRITVRRALESLRQQNVIVRRRGVGSFVASRPQGMDSRLTGSLNEFLASAAALRTRCISLGPAKPPAEVAMIFGLARGEPAVLLKTVGSLDEDPVAYLEIWFPPELGGALTPEEIDGNVPIVRLLERKLQLRLSGAEQVVEADHAGKEPARHLGVDASTPILRVKRIYYAHPRRPIEVAYVRYHPQRYRYAVDFKL
jgi:GntR family transcriptional regulator